METCTSPLFLMATDEPALPLDGQPEYVYRFGGCIYSEDHIQKIQKTIANHMCEVHALVQDDPHCSVSLRLTGLELDCRFDGYPRACVFRAQRNDKQGDVHELLFAFHRSYLDFPSVIMDSRASTRGLVLTANEVAARLHTIMSALDWQKGVLQRVAEAQSELDKHQDLVKCVRDTLRDGGEDTTTTAEDSDATTMDQPDEHYELPESPAKRRRIPVVVTVEDDDTSPSECKPVKFSDALARITDTSSVNIKTPTPSGVVSDHRRRSSKRSR